ncbi:hypothetical protein VPH35_070088 [Triticum aestivum]
MARLATILSFGDHTEEGAGAFPEAREDYQQKHDDDDDATSDASGDSFEFVFAQPLAPPKSPAREPAAFPKSASMGTGEAALRFRLRDILCSGGRSHSDGKEKFLFLQPTPAKPKPRTSALCAATGGDKRAAKKTQGAVAAPTEMDMATTHRLFYSKMANTKTSYLPYRHRTCTSSYILLYLL